MWGALFLHVLCAFQYTLLIIIGYIKCKKNVMNEQELRQQYGIQLVH